MGHLPTLRPTFKPAAPLVPGRGFCGSTSPRNFLDFLLSLTLLILPAADPECVIAVFATASVIDATTSPSRSSSTIGADGARPSLAQARVHDESLTFSRC